VSECSIRSISVSPLALTSNNGNSLPPGKLATTIQLAYSFAVVFTFPLQNYPSLEIVRRSLERFIHGEKGLYSDQQDSPIMNVITTMVVVLLSIIAISK
jgi:proton-coupled amino acid transporter